MLVKICGMREAATLELAASLGVNLCGFIFHPKSPRHITPREAARLPSFGMARVGVFVSGNTEEILTVMREARLDFAQLHGSQPASAAASIGAGNVIRVLWPERMPTLQALTLEADKHADACAFYLLDAGASGGGSGAPLQWRNLPGLKLAHPWLLAGGLTPENIMEAVDTCAPGGIDLNSGLESAPGIKDAAKIIRAVSLVRPR